uniref:Uncharacterized protein n=1 Tax=Meloidogyne hapla TaxID=6305 RepID=A0A1I8BZW3_MELHA
MPMHPVALSTQSKAHHSFIHQRRHSFRDITTSRIHQQQRIPLLMHHSAKSPPPLIHKSSVARWKTQPSRHPGVHEAIFFADQPVTGNLGFCGYLLTVMSAVFLLLTAPFSVFFCIKIVKEYERAVIFRLGRLIPGGARGPG